MGNGIEGNPTNKYLGKLEFDCLCLKLGPKGKVELKIEICFDFKWGVHVNGNNF